MSFSLSSLSSTQAAQLQQNRQTESVSSASLTVTPTETKASIVTNTFQADVFVSANGGQQRPHPRLDPARFPGASTSDSMKWVDHGKPGLDTAAYERLKTAVTTMELPPGFDVVLLGPSRNWPTPAVEVAVKLPDGRWEQNAYLPKDGKLTQISNLDPQALARRPPELRGPLSANLAFDEPKPVTEEQAATTTALTTTTAATTFDLSKVNTRVPIRPEVEAAVQELNFKGLDVQLLGASTRKGDRYENFELVVNGKQGTYLNDDGLFVNRDDDGQRLNGRSASREAQLHAEFEAKQNQRNQRYQENKNHRVNINNKHESILNDSDE